MTWLVSWLMYALVGFLLVYVSLYLGCLICRAPEAYAGKVAAASILPFILVAAYCFWFISSLGALQYLSGGLLLGLAFLLPVFLAVLLGAPWMLRPMDGSSWGAAWGGAALGGVFLCILVVAAFGIRGEIVNKADLAKAKVEKTGALAAYGLSCPPDAEFDTVRIQMGGEAIAHAQQYPGYKRWSPAWVDRWPCNDIISFRYSRPAADLAAYLEQDLGQAGFTVRRAGTAYVTGSNGSIFAAYQIEDGRCMVRVWKDFAQEMEAVSAAEMK